MRRRRQRSALFQSVMACMTRNEVCSRIRAHLGGILVELGVFYRNIKDNKEEDEELSR